MAVRDLRFNMIFLLTGITEGHRIVKGSKNCKLALDNPGKCPEVGLQGKIM